MSRQAKVGLPENELLAGALRPIRQAYGDVRIGLVSGGRLVIGSREYGPHDFPRHEPLRLDGVVVHPLTVNGELAGALEVPAGTTPLDDALAATLTGQLSVSLENARLYAELETLFRRYMSPDVAASLLADPGQAALGGSLVELTALFADLQGSAAFCERVCPREVVETLNRYHSVAVPCILDNGGTIVQFAGDAVLAVFKSPAPQPARSKGSVFEAPAFAVSAQQDDHARKAAQAGLELQAASEELAGGDPDHPRFRVGVNTGLAFVGNIGSAELRGFNAMGDAVNVAARLRTLAEPGTVVIGSPTRDRLGPGAVARSLGDLTLKGKERSVHAFVLEALLAVAR